MAKATNSELLQGILLELDQVLTIQKQTLKAAKSSGDSAEASAMAGTFKKVDKKDAVAVSNVSTSIASLGVAMQGMKKVSKKDALKAADIIKTLADAVSNVKIDKSTMKSFNEMMQGIATMLSMFAYSSMNIFQMMKNFTYIKGFGVGKVMGRFYKGILSGLSSSGFLHSILENLMGKVKKGKKSMTEDVVTLINVLLLADSEKLSALTKTLKKFPKDAGKKFGDFLMGVLKPVISIKKEKIKEDDIKTFKSLIKALGALNIFTILSVWMATKLLKPAGAKSLGKFFSTLVETINKIGKKKVESAAKLLKSISLLFLCMALSLAIVVIIAKVFDWKTIGKGFLIMGGLIVMAIVFIGVLTLLLLGGKKSPVRKGMKGAKEIALLFLCLALALTICILIGSLFSLKSIGKGFLIMAGVIGFAWLMMLFLGSKTFAKKARKAWAGIGAMVIIILVTILAAYIFMKMGPFAGLILKAGGVSLLLVAGFAALIWALSHLKMKQLAKGMIAAVAVVGLIWLTSKAMMEYMKLMKYVKNLTWSQLGKGSAMVAAVIGGFGILIGALAAILLIPGAAAFLTAGAATVAAIAGIIYGVSKAVQQYIIAVMMISRVSNSELSRATDIMTSKHGMIGFVKQAAKAFKGIKGDAKDIETGARAMNPMFDAIGKFIDVIQKMAKLKIIDHFDEKGRPVYRPMKMSEFSLAAIHLSIGFSTFISELLKPFEENSDNIWKLKYICGVLGTGRFKKLLKNLNYFVTTIQKMASQAIADKWDKNGNPIHYLKFTNKDFIAAAVTLGVAFGAFISELVKPFEDKSDNITNLNRIVKVLGRGGRFMNLLFAINYFIDIIKKMASSQMAIEWDKKGKPIKFQKISTKEFIKAAIVLATAFSIFVSTLAQKIDKETAKHIKMLGKYLGKNGTLLSIIIAVNAALRPMSRLASGYFKVDGKEVQITGELLKTAAYDLGMALVQFLTPLAELADNVSRNQITKMKRLISATIPLVMNTLIVAKLLKKANDANKDFLVHSMNLGTGMVMLLQPVKMVDGMSRKATKKFNDSMGDLVAAYNQVANILPDTSSRMMMLAMALRMADNEIVKKTTQRVNAIKTNIKAYTAITKSVIKLAAALRSLNKEMREWNKMQNNYTWLNKWKDMMDTQIKQLETAAEKYKQMSEEFAQKLQDYQSFVDYGKITEAIQNAKGGYSVTYNGSQINGITPV